MTNAINTNTNNASNNSILIIGATGKTGLHLIRQFAKQPNPPKVHAFCRDPSKLSAEDKAKCFSIVTGNARNESDIQDALTKTNANWIIVCIGNGDDVSKTDIRTTSAQATVNVLMKPQFGHVRVLVVSSNGAGPTKILVGFGIGKMIAFYLRHVMRDHTGQEKAFSAIAGRVTVVRPTSLTDDEATGKLAFFGDHEKPPTIKTDRSDLASWIVAEIGQSESSGRTVNLTCVKK